MIFVGNFHVVFTGKRYKAYAKNLLCFDFAICHFFYNHQFLITIRETDRYDQARAWTQLINQGWGNVRSSGGDYDAIIRGMFGPAEIAVIVANFYIVIAQFIKAFACVCSQIFNYFNGINLLHQPGEDCRLITGTGADFQNNIGGFRIQ